MDRSERVPLASLTTFKVGGDARYVFRCHTKEDVVSALAAAHEMHLPWYVLGGGSNVLAHDDGYEGVILQMRIPGLTSRKDDAVIQVSAGAGVPWDDVVREAARMDAWGIETLAGIPGTAGAAPVQNIGAYGAELSQVLASVEVYESENQRFRTLTRDECAFEYRDSIFKHDPSLIIVNITLALHADGKPNLSYRDLAHAAESGVPLRTPEEIGTAVRHIRASKFPSLRDYGTAGSFFKNPLLSEQVYAALCARYGTVPQFPSAHGIKVPLAFILDKALSLRGFRMGHAWLFGAQPLVLTLDPGGTAHDVELLASFVETRVREETAIHIEREVRTLENKK